MLLTLIDAFSLTSQAKTIESLLPPEALSQIKANGRAIHSGVGIPAILPLHPVSESIRSALAKEKPSILVEVVFTLPRVEKAGSSTSTTELAAIYGILRSLSSLQGIEYYSASRKQMRTFYAESYIIDSPDTKNKLPDPAPPAPVAIPTSETLYAFQRDLTFGANSYRYDYSSSPDSIFLSSTNITRMSYGLIPVLAPKALTTRLLVVQARDVLLFYIESGASAPGFLRGKLEESFANRAEALFQWFTAKYTVKK